MPKLRIVRDNLLQTVADDEIDMEDFLLLYEINQSKNLDFPYWKYQAFSLDAMTDEDCIAEFRFHKNDIPRLERALDFPFEITCYLYNDLVVSSTEALCILLRRLACPCRFSDMIPRFGRPVPQLCLIFNQTLEFIDYTWGRLLSDFNQPFLSPQMLLQYSTAIYNRGAPLDQVWGFIDGTTRPCSRPKRDQRQIYNGHKRYHCLKYQSITTPNGMIANLFGPIEGKRHDCAMLRSSGVLNLLQQYSHDPQGNQLSLYGDPAYPLNPYLLCPFKGANLTNAEKDFNKSMSAVRVSVEWIFGDVVNRFKFTDFKKTQKIGLSPVAKQYRVSALLNNSYTCLYKNNTSTYFDLEPPILEEYLT